MNLPQKISFGDTFRVVVVNTINKIIDCLAATRVKGDNKTIKVQETANGYLISTIPQPQKGGGGGSSTVVSDIRSYFGKIKVINEDGTYTCAMSKTGDFGNMEELPTMIVYPIQTPWNSSNVINYGVGSVILVQCIPQQAFGY